MTFPGWIPSTGGFDVERQEGRRPGGQAYLPLDAGTRRVIWHTTEGSSVDGAVGTLRANFSAPHFVVGQGRVVQMRPLTAQAATVRGDNSNAWQVECVAFSQQALWLPDAGTREPIVALLQFFRDRLNVPLARPDGWRDDCSDIDGVWATEGNSRRRSNRAPSFVGHVMHLEWPANTHWDQGAIRWTPLLKEADDMAILTDAEQRQLREFLATLRAGIGKVSDPSTPATPNGAANRIAAAVKTVEAGGDAGPHGHTPEQVPHRHRRGGRTGPAAPE